MTLTASLPTKALASLLAALLLSTTLPVTMPARAELSSVLSAFDVTTAEAHTQQSCHTQTLQVRNRHGTATHRTYTRTVCVDVDHSHPVRGLIAGIGAGLACGVLGSGLGPGGALAAGAACGGAVGALLS